MSDAIKVRLRMAYIRGFRAAVAGEGHDGTPTPTIGEHPTAFKTGYMRGRRAVERCEGAAAKYARKAVES